MTAHGEALRKESADDELVDGLKQDYTRLDLSPAEHVMLDYAVKLTAESATCSEDDIDALRAEGWRDEDILDIAQVAAMFNYTNRLASGLGWVPNAEYFSLGR